MDKKPVVSVLVITYNRVWDDYVYTKALEAYARETLKVDGNFSRHKKELFVSAVYRTLRQPNPKNWSVVKNIRRWESTAVPGISPVRLFKKALDKLLRRYA